MLRVRACVYATVSAVPEPSETALAVCGCSELAAAASVQGVRFVLQRDAAPLCRSGRARARVGVAALARR